MTTAPPDDRRAVETFLEHRDEEAFNVLYERHTPRLYGLALRLTSGDEEAAGEVVQEAWVRAVAALDGFRWDSALGSWLGAVVVNCWRESRRKGLREADWSDGIESATASAGLRPDGSVDVVRALDSLPTGYRSVLVLFGVYGYSHAEIGSILGIATGTSKSQLSRARQALREALT